MSDVATTGYVGWALVEKTGFLQTWVRIGRCRALSYGDLAARATAEVGSEVG